MKNPHVLYFPHETNFTLCASALMVGKYQFHTGRNSMLLQTASAFGYNSHKLNMISMLETSVNECMLRHSQRTSIVV